MKQSFLIGGATLLGALSAAVLIKYWPDESPGTAGEKNENSRGMVRSIGEPENPSAVSPPGRSGANVASSPEEASNKETEIDAAALEERRDEFRAGLRERQMARLTDTMAKWSVALGLDEKQQAGLLELADTQFDEMEAMAATVEGGDSSGLSDKARRAMAIMSGRALEESMVALLTPAQKEKYREFENVQTRNRAEAGALRQLATLQEDLMLTSEQRNDAYGVLFASQLGQAEANSDVSSMIKQFAGQAGVNVDPALQGMISSIANQGLEKLAAGDSLDGDGLKELAENAMDSSVEEQVVLLRPVLTEAQLNLYRGQLKDRLKNLETLIPGSPNGQ